MSAEGLASISTEVSDPSKGKKKEEAKLVIIEGRIEKAEDERRAKIQDDDDLKQGKVGNENYTYNNGHATVEDLLEEEDDIRNTIKGDEMLLRMAVNMGLSEDIFVVIDTGATYSCISHQFYVKLREEKLIKGELPVQKVTLIVAVGR